MSPWHSLVGIPKYAAGASGTITLPSGAIVICVVVHSTGAGSVAMFGGASIPLAAGTSLNVDYKHALTVARGAGASAQIVFTGTDSYFVHYVTPGHA